MKKTVRILLLGDEGVGKTSLIMSLVSEEFPEMVPAKAEEITIPADVTPERVPTNIVDFSVREQTQEELADEVQRADVICLVYAVDEQESLNRVMDYWLPMIRKIVGDDLRPIVLVGNKTDATSSSTLDVAVEAMNKYMEVETCVECSAKSMKNISEMFYYAQKAVLHPTAPLYDAEKKQLQPNCKEAMERIFTICDIDNDGVLNDVEVNNFQCKCFNAPLVPQALEDVKTIVRKYCPSGGVVNNGLTKDGFLTLQLLFIQRGRHETTWTVLRKFGYDDNLVLSREYIAPRLQVEERCSTELSHLAYHFLQSLFDRYDQDKDGCLSPEELASLFSTCPFMPWSSDVLSTVQTSERQYITNAGYMAQWTLTAYLDRSRAMEYLAYLGYLYEQETQLTAIHVTRDRKLDMRHRQTSRNVFLCHVIGPKGVGKTHLLQGVLGRDMSYVKQHNLGAESTYTINTVPVYGTEKYLLMRKVDAEITQLLQPGDLDCDVACLAYDVTNPKSFKFCASAYEKHFKGGDVPVLIVACKSEQSHVAQDFPVTPEEYCKSNKLPVPQYYSSVELSKSDLYSKLATIAHSPHYSLMQGRDTVDWIKLAGALVLLGAVGAGIYKYSKLRHSRSYPG